MSRIVISPIKFDSILSCHIREFELAVNGEERALIPNVNQKVEAKQRWLRHEALRKMPESLRRLIES